MTISQFNRVNKDLPSSDQYSSPRNLAAGTLKQKNISVLDDRVLTFMAWQLVGYGEDLTNKEQMDLMTSWGFSVADKLLIEHPSSEIIDSTFQNFVEERDSLDFEIDGIIFKYNLPKDRNSAGFTEHHPKWSIAWKFKSKGEVTTINSITWQVGRTGVITPVAEVEPVQVAGAVIKRATLHNAEMIETLNVAPGDQVSLIRAGDVIPKILEVVEKGKNEYSFPEYCPSCNSPTIRSGVDLKCKSDHCPDRDIQQINYWLRQTEIKGLGEKGVQKLYDEGILNHYADLYDPNLTESVLESKLGKNGIKIYEEINKTRELPFSTFLAALGIQNLGPKMGKILADRYVSYEDLKSTTVEELIKLSGISDLTASYILDGVRDPNTGDRVLLHGLTLLSPSEQRTRRLKKSSSGLDAWFADDTGESEDGQRELSDPLFEGKKVYITGSVPGFNKKQLEEGMELRGIEWHKSVSSNLDYLVCGDNAGQKKIDNATKKGVQVLSWEEFNTQLRNPM